jgi:hypothetical protein
MAEKTREIHVRLPEELHERLSRAAREDDRSLHSEILALLKEALAARQQRKLSQPS